MIANNVRLRGVDFDRPAEDHRPRTSDRARMATILVVEDNPDLAYGLRNNLEIEGYEVTVAADGPAGLAAARTVMPDLIILDLMIPGMDGYRVLKTLRDEGRDIPVLILTARGEEADKVRGFRLGADDYVTKPFGVLELLARVEAVLRRSTVRDAAHPPPERFGDVEVNPATHGVTRAGEQVPLAPKEFELLIALLRRDGAVVSRHELMKEVWGYADSVVSRTVDTHIAELRRKLEADPADPRHILTVRKAGYRLKR
jgi:DNA-binding response OmpR family regulator